MFDFFNVNSIKLKFIKIFIMFVIIPFAIGVLVLNYTYRQVIQYNTTQSTRSVMSQISNGIQNEIKNLELLATTVALDDGIIDLVNSWNVETDSSQRQQTEEQISMRLSYLFHNNDRIETVLFWFKDKGYYSYKGELIAAEEKIRTIPQYKSALETNKTLVCGTMDNFTYNYNTYILPNNTVFSIFVTPLTPKNRDSVEMIYMAYRTSVFDSLFETIAGDLFSDMVVLDENNTIMISKNKDLIGKPYKNSDKIPNFSNDTYKFRTKNEQNKKVLESFYRIEGRNWTIINNIDYNLITSQYNKIITGIIFFCIILLLLFSIFLVAFFKDIDSPIRQLIANMQLVDTGNLNVEVKVEGVEEMTYLSMAFNRMIVQIKKSIKDIETKEAEKLKSEIDALQSQISPHFLANTLNSIRIMAMISKNESIEKMTSALIELIRASFGKNGRYNTIEMEFENLKNYEYIMKIRHGDGFNINYEIDDEIKQYKILKLLIQPIVENAIFHNVNEVDNAISIEIKAYKSNSQIVIEVKDNGIGLTKEQIDMLLLEDLQNTKGFNGVGVFNVNRRILLNHGEGFGIHIHSELNQFTNVIITLPIIVEA